MTHTHTTMHDTTKKAHTTTHDTPQQRTHKNAWHTHTTMHDTIKIHGHNSVRVLYLRWSLSDTVKTFIFAESGFCAFFAVDIIRAVLYLRTCDYRNTVNNWVGIFETISMMVLTEKAQNLDNLKNNCFYSGLVVEFCSIC